MTAYDVALRTNPGRAQDVELGTPSTASVATGEFFPLVLDGSRRLADLLADHRARNRRRTVRILQGVPT